MKQMFVISAVVVVLVLFLEVGVALPNTPTESHHEIRPLPSTFHQGNTSDGFPQHLHPNKDHRSELLPKSASSEGGHGGEGGEGSNERYPLAVIDFARVQTPFIIGLWIFCACLGKIALHISKRSRLL
ncbi:hypothetical protein Pcinc_034345 [Petrolisthes cinctipes]|uniref:Transmembrane protein n=1 Tax=Petrolisthes cinctipes TaxID=88211 RepID=A0AAE1EQH6_PETCI|nr:hypothetical protein Pcinc_034345 [Petrolisthes cinctipes]